MKWQQKLTKKQMRHVREIGAKTFKEVRENVLYQSKMRFPCWNCVIIGRKLGIEVELTEFHKFHATEKE